MPKKFKYTAMSFMCPFFATNENANTDNIIPVLKAAQMYDPDAVTPEYKIDVKKEPEHYCHWYYDKNNPF